VLCKPGFDSIEVPAVVSKLHIDIGKVPNTGTDCVHVKIRAFDGRLSSGRR
jgi:hypothetical protein